jgi:hypothetical protein
MHVAFPGGTGGAAAAADIWHTKVRAGAAFTASAFVAALAANYSLIQLLNPVGSGVTLVIYGAISTVSLTSRPTIREYDTALTTLDMNGVNLLRGGAAGLGAVRTEQAAAVPGSRTNSTDALANTPIYWPFPWLGQLSAGEGIVFCGSAVNSQVSANIWWYEE